VAGSTGQTPVSVAALTVRGTAFTLAGAGEVSRGAEKKALPAEQQQPLVAAQAGGGPRAEPAGPQAAGAFATGTLIGERRADRVAGLVVGPIEVRAGVTRLA
jgi:hypothetical protein